jgi:hypothetical protein
MLSQLAATAAWTYYLIDHSQKAADYYGLSNLFASVADFISQCCIFYIFWQLGEKIDLPKPVEQ